MPIITRPRIIQKNVCYSDANGVNIETVLADLQAKKIINPRTDPLNRSHGDELNRLAGIYHANNTTIEVEYRKGRHHKFRVTGDEPYVSQTINLLNGVYS